MIARNPEQVKLDLQQDAGLGAERSLTKGERGAIIGQLNKTLGGDANRRLTLAWLFSKQGELSTKELDDDRWWALWKWVGFWQDDSGGWNTYPEFPVEAWLCFTEACKAQGLAKPSQKDKTLADDQSLVIQATAFLGGVVTNIDNQSNNGVGLPLDYKTRKKIMDFLDGADEI